MLQDKLKTIKKTFKSISFEEDTHTYFVNGAPLDISVSGIIKNFVKQTDFNKIATSIDKRDKLIPGTTRKLWDNKSKTACALGDQTHFFGETYAFHRNIKPTNGYEEGIKKFWDTLPSHIVPAEVELKMYHKKYLFGGMQDILLYNTKDNTFILGDYKTNFDIFKNFKEQRLTGEFSDLLATDYNKYQIQFSLYQILFEQTGMKFSRRVLVWVKPDGTFENYFTENYTARLHNFLKKHYA